MMLVDTSLWVDHLRQGDKKLAEMLRADEVACHPFVIGELACGNLHNREEVLTLLWALTMLRKVEDAEVLAFISGHRLMGKGLGLVDVHLLASCLLEGVGLWTRDKILARTASRLGIGSI